MKNIQNITCFNLKGSKYKIQQVFNGKHYLQVYKKFLFLYIEVKTFEFNSIMELSDKYSEIINHFSYIENNLK